MALLEFGTSSGLAYRHNFNADMNRLLQEEQMINKARESSEAKAIKYGDEMKFATGFTPYYQKMIDGVANENIKAIGKLLHENGNNPAASPMVWSEYKRLANAIGNNEWTVKSDLAKLEYGKAIDFYAKEPDMQNDPSYNKFMNEWAEFKETGKITKVNPITGETYQQDDFVFVNPISTVDLNKIAETSMANAPATQGSASKTVAGHNLLSASVSDAEMMRIARADLGNPKNLAAAKQIFMSQDEEIQKQYYGNVYNWYKDTYLNPKKTQTSDWKLNPAYYPGSNKSSQNKPEIETVKQLAVAYKQAEEKGVAPLTIQSTAYLLGGNPEKIINGKTTVSGVYLTEDGSDVELKGINVIPVPGIKNTDNGIVVSGNAIVEPEKYMEIKGDTLYYGPGDTKNQIDFYDPKYGKDPNHIFVPKETKDPNTGIFGFFQKVNGKEGFPPGTLFITEEGKRNGLSSYTKQNGVDVNMLTFPVYKPVDASSEVDNIQVNRYQGLPDAMTNPDYTEKANETLVSKSGKIINEASIEATIKANPGATREQAIEALKNQ